MEKLQAVRLGLNFDKTFGEEVGIIQRAGFAGFTQVVQLDESDEIFYLFKENAEVPFDRSTYDTFELALIANDVELVEF